MKNYTRDNLIDISKKSIVHVSKWGNRDTPSAQEWVGKLLALLSAWCSFKVLNEWNLVTDDHTIWIEVYYPQFSHFDWDLFDLNDISTLWQETFYLPTKQRLKECKWEDWY
jgi:hypothetical protein